MGPRLAIDLARNDDYWKTGQPYLDDIFFRLLPDASPRALALERGDAHLSPFRATSSPSRCRV